MVVHLGMMAQGWRHVAREVYWGEVGHYVECDTSGEDPNCADQNVFLNVYDHLHYPGNRWYPHGVDMTICTI